MRSFLLFHSEDEVTDDSEADESSDSDDAAPSSNYKVEIEDGPTRISSAGSTAVHLESEARDSVPPLKRSNSRPVLRKQSSRYVSKWWQIKISVLTES